MIANKKRLFKEAMKPDVARLLNVVLVDAYYKDIPEIQLVPDEAGLKVLYIMGSASSIFMILPKEYEDGIIARIKLMTGLAIDTRGKIVNASFDFVFDPQEVITFSVSIAPAKLGGKIVLRL